MSVFLKTAAGIFIALILWLCIEKRGKDMSLLLTLSVCTMIITSAITFLRPIIEFIRNVQDIGNIDKEFISVILKVVGIGVITELTVLICKDVGNESMGKALQILSALVVLWISIPVFEKLLELISEILSTV